MPVGSRRENRFQPVAPLVPDQPGQIGAVKGQDIEADQLGRRLLTQQRNPGGGRMNPGAQGIPVQMLRARLTRAHDQLGVQNRAIGQPARQRGDDLREIRGQRLLAAPVQGDPVPIPADDAAEAVPLGLVRESGTIRNPVDRAGEHRIDGQIEWQAHTSIPARPPADSDA